MSSPMTTTSGAPVAYGLALPDLRGAAHLLHPARGEENRGVVVGDQRRARVEPVAPLPEKVQKPLPYLATLHAPHPGITLWTRAHVPGTQVRPLGPPVRA